MDMKRLSAAYVRGYASKTGVPSLPETLCCKPLQELTEQECDQLCQAGKQAELKLYRFKDHSELPRVQKALGFLRGVWPESLLDVGSGRGAFLFPFLCAFPDTPVTSVDLLDYRVAFLQDIHRGGVQVGVQRTTAIPLSCKRSTTRSSQSN